MYNEMAMSMGCFAVPGPGPPVELVWDWEVNRGGLVVENDNEDDGWGEGKEVIEMDDCCRWCEYAGRLISTCGEIDIEVVDVDM